MRLFYQSVGVARRSTTGPYATTLRRQLQEAASPGTEVEVHGLSAGRGVADQYRYLEMLDAQEIVENGLRAEREGYDAVLVGNIFEPGLYELREQLNIPVIGLCEASVHMACLMGASFSVVNVNPKFKPRVIENVARCGLAGRLASLEHMRVERRELLDRAFEEDDARDEVVRQFTVAAEAALAKGAETVIPSGGIVMAILTMAGIHRIERAPVVNGVVALVKMGELAVGVRRLTGGFTSKQLTFAPPSGKVLQDVRASYGEHLYPDAG